MQLVVRRGLALENLDGLRSTILRLPGAESVLLNRTGDTFYLIGFKQGGGKRRSISVEIPRNWLEDGAMMESVEKAAMQFGSLMSESPDGHGRLQPSRLVPPMGGRDIFREFPAQGI